MRYNLNTAIQIYFYNSNREVELFETTFTNKKRNIFYCNWQEDFGQQLLQNQQMGFTQTATLKIRFIEELYNLLVQKKVIISKNCNDIINADGRINYNNPSAFVLIGGASLIDNNFISLRVRRMLSND